jgi:hypothetical protein
MRGVEGFSGAASRFRLCSACASFEERAAKVEANGRPMFLH